MVVLFVDLLGTRSRWHTGGREAAETAFNRFAEVMNRALQASEAASIQDGVIETDSAALVFTSSDEALRCARSAFLSAFSSARTRADERLWLRGTIMPADENTAKRRETPILAGLPQVRLSTLNGKLLDAIATEKAGFKGMRLLIHNSLVNRALGTRFVIPVGQRSFIPFRRLNNSAYPGRLERDYEDFFWMATPEETEWERQKLIMASRLRWSSRDSEEFLQAAATQVVFHECAAILASLEHRQE